MSTIANIQKRLNDYQSNNDCLASLINEDERVRQFLYHNRGFDSQEKVIFRRAAVLIPVIRSANGSLSILLTQRAKHLKHHPGEISFPGGSAESYDTTLADTAIRETHEEVGIKPEQVEILGKLPSQNTISQYRVTPFVGVVADNFQLTLDVGEVERTLEIPWEFAIDSRNHQLKKVTQAQHSYSYYEINYSDFRIWGATARMLVNLSQIIHFSE
jgi:8-oxo-dGTP pyrophosphatase MutT (NUDIX family)